MRRNLEICSPRISVDTVKIVNTMHTTDSIRTYFGYAKYYGEENARYQLLATDDILRFHDRFPKNTVTVHSDGVDANCSLGRMPITKEINTQLEADRIAAAENV
jgi:hypothetical protein